MEDCEVYCEVTCSSQSDRCLPSPDEVSLRCLLVLSCLVLSTCVFPIQPVCGREYSLLIVHLLSLDTLIVQRLSISLCDVMLLATLCYKIVFFQ